MTGEVTDALMELSGGDPYVEVKHRSEAHQRAHGCGLHNAGGPQMQLVAALARLADARTIVDLGSGLGYSTLWLADAAGDGGSVVGIDDDPAHTAEATSIAEANGLADRVSYMTGRVAEVLPTLFGPVDMIHDDAWFAKVPDHLDVALGLLRPGGLLTMVNWFLLVDALTGEPRNDWATFAGPNWADETRDYARLLASRNDIKATWVARPPIAFAVKL